SAAMIDIDYFKAFNDRYGHQRGDEALCQVSEVLRAAVSRPADLVARYGGEEFLVLMPSTAADGAVHVAERLRSRVEALAIPHSRSRVSPHLTVSVGVAGEVPDLASPPSLLIAAADHALYWAKRSGRNCVRSWDERPGRRRIAGEPHGESRWRVK